MNYPNELVCFALCCYDNTGGNGLLRVLDWQGFDNLQDVSGTADPRGRGAFFANGSVVFLPSRTVGIVSPKTHMWDAVAAGVGTPGPYIDQISGHNFTPNVTAASCPLEYEDADPPTTVSFLACGALLLPVSTFPTLFPGGPGGVPPPPPPAANVLLVQQALLTLGGDTPFDPDGSQQPFVVRVWRNNLSPLFPRGT